MFESSYPSSRGCDDDGADLLAVQQTLRGDRQAFAALVERYTPVVYRLAYRMLGHREEAEDVVQEVFFKAYRSLGRFRLSARFYTWLYTIALNTVRSRLRRAGRRAERERTGRAFPELDRSAIDPADYVLAREAERIVARALDSLRPIYREVFLLRHMEDLSIREIAEVLSLPEGTVKTRLHRARAALVPLVVEETDDSPRSI